MDHKDYIREIDQSAERRFYAHPVTSRAATQGNLHTIEGIAAKINSRTNLGWFDEEIAPGAFDEVISTDDVRCLFNHDPNLILARRNQTTTTLELWINEEGHLAYRYTTPNRSYALDLQDAIMAGDVSQCSFAFSVAEEAWEYSEDRTQNDLRKILKIKNLYDVAPVTYPAYTDTTVAKRSYSAIKPNAHGAHSIDIYKRKLTIINRKF
jgi:HK97 family phage prohead protease